MKTPKRNHKIPTERQHLDIEPDSLEEDYKQQDARWKRKNRISQFKRSIARQAEEIRNLRTLLESMIQDGVTAAQRAALDWVANNLQLDFHPQSDPGDGTPWFLNYKPVLTFPKGGRK